MQSTLKNQSRYPPSITTRFSSSSSTNSTSTRFNSYFHFTATAITFSSLLFLNSNGSLQLDAPPSENFTLDPATKTPLPNSIPSPSSFKSSSDLKLVGLGVRTVSFLSVRVYVSGLYVEEKALNGKLQSLPAWKGYNKERLLSLKGEESEEGKRGEELIRELVKAGIPCVVRIGK